MQDRQPRQREMRVGTWSRCNISVSPFFWNWRPCWLGYEDEIFNISFVLALTHSAPRSILFHLPLRIVNPLHFDLHLLPRPFSHSTHHLPLISFSSSFRSLILIQFSLLNPCLRVVHSELLNSLYSTSRIAQESKRKAMTEACSINVGKLVDFEWKIGVAVSLFDPSEAIITIWLFRCSSSLSRQVSLELWYISCFPYVSSPSLNLLDFLSPSLELSKLSWIFYALLFLSSYVRFIPKVWLALDSLTIDSLALGYLILKSLVLDSLTLLPFLDSLALPRLSCPWFCGPSSTLLPLSLFPLSILPFLDSLVVFSLALPSLS